MATREIKSKLVLDGEREYRAGLESAYKSVSQLGRELKVTQARYLDNADSMEAQTAKAEVLRKEIEAQKEIITSLSQRMQYAERAYDGNTEAQDLYAQKIDKAMRALSRMEKELGTTESAINEMGSTSSEASRNLDKVEASTKDVGEASQNASQKVETLSGGFTVLKGAMGNLLSDALRTGANYLKEFASDSVEIGSDLNEVDNVVTTAFGNASNEIKAFADTADTQFGLSSLSAQKYAGKMGAALNAIGLKDQALTMSQTLTGLSGDLASFWNITADEAYGKLFSGVISGETEGLKALGIVMNDANLQAFALTQGIKKKTSAMTADEKTLLRYQYVMNATSQAQGDFAKTSGGFANQMRIASLQVENTKAAMGEKLLPTVTDVISKFNTWMQSDYGKRVIGKIADATGDFAEGALAKLQTGLGWVMEHMETIKALTESIAIGFLAAKVSSFTMTMVNLVKTLVSAGKATGALNALMAANPAVAVGIAVAALTLGLIALVKNYQTLDDKLKSLKLEVPQTSVDAVTSAIDEGIDAAKKTHEVTVVVNADTQGLKEQLEGFLDEDSSGGEKITKKEYKAISKYVTDIVQPDIDEAKKLMKAQKEDFKSNLLAIVDDDGNSVFSEERADELAGGLGEKTQGLINELEGYKNDYIALAKQIYKDGRTPTEEEIANLNALLDKIGEVRIKLNEAQDTATQVLKARTARVEAGKGTEEDFGASVGYVQQIYTDKAMDQHAGYEKAIAELQTDIDTWNATLEKGGLTGEERSELTANLKKAQQDMQDLFAADAQVDPTAYAEQQQELQKLFDGMAKANPDAAAAIQNMAALRDNYSTFLQTVSDIEGLNLDQLDDVNLQGIIDEIFKQSGQSLTAEEIKEGLLGGDETINNAVNAAIDQIKEDFEGSIETSSEALTNNPLLAYLQSMIDSGSLDKLDVTKLDGALESTFKAIDFVQRGSEVGTDLVDGVNGGIGIGADNLTVEDLAKLRDRVLELTRTAFDSHSPARVMYPVGEDVTAGLTTGMTDDTANAGVTTAAATIAATIAGAFDLSSAGEAAITAFVDGMKSKSGTATSRAKTIALAAKGAMYQYNSFYSIGQSNMQGFIDGLNSKKGSVTGAMSDLMKAAIQAARDALDQHSPSRVFREIGVYSAMGYEIGFADRMDQTERLIQDRLRQSAQVPETAMPTASRGQTPSEGGIAFTQNVYANETSYAGQQREAARQARLMVRRMNM